MLWVEEEEEQVLVCEPSLSIRFQTSTTETSPSRSTRIQRETFLSLILTRRLWKGIWEQE